ncbi:hypothetical protein INT43_001940 [Umbelopsis isabellina]|uniref:Uncharacterized protein n=1 Tax=Mortierella isabellina TaxID=91625 RepID=A0A8H7UDM2_MORIS|nr:hypothetical protein INT43_001940 [Umbelopsis isabellina]
MVSTRSSSRPTDTTRDNSHKVSQEKVPSPELHSDSEEDSDDEAPEAVSTSTSKSAALQSEQAERQAKLKLAAEEKEKRRLKDQRLKEQRESSKKVTKKEKKQKITIEDNDEEEARNEIEADEVTTVESHESKQVPKLLPQELLEQFSKEEKAEKKRIHLSAKDFERMAEEEEQKQKKQKSKKRNLTEGKQIGEYTVKVLSKRPKPQPIDQGLIDFRNQHFARAQIPRRDAVLNASQGRKGGATTFARSGNVSKK